jgi:DNA-binding MarR family transcriptional regulator
VSAAGQAEPRWLDDKEMRAWRAYIVGSQMLAYQLHRELQDSHDVSLADYEILVRLSEQPRHRMRMSQLANDVASSKSRVSHQVARLEAAGLVRRTECPSDGRGVFAQLTDDGMRQLEQAAPTHVEGVRAHLIDLLSDEQQTVIAEVFEKVIAHLHGSGC